MQAPVWNLEYIYLLLAVFFLLEDPSFSQKFRYMADISINLTRAKCQDMVEPSRSAFCFALFDRDDFSGKVMVFEDKLNNDWCCLIEGQSILHVDLNGELSIYYSVEVTIKIRDGEKNLQF